MKEPNIDELFKQKLGQAKRKPSADAWARLEHRLPEAEPEKKRAFGFWYYSAAAVITLLMISVGVYFARPGATPDNLAVSPVQEEIKFEVESAPQVAYQETESVEPETTTEPAWKPAPEETEAAGGSKAASNTKTALNSQFNRLSNGNGGNKKDKKEVKTNDKPQPAVPAATPKSKHRPTFPENPASDLMAHVKSEVSEPAVATVKPARQAEAKAPIWANGPIEVMVLSSNQDEKNTEVLLAAANPVNQEENDQKPNLFKKLVKQAINLKNGEEVNLQELGLANRIAFETKIGNQRISKEINL